MHRDNQWFDDIYITYYPKLVLTARRILYDKNLAEDMVQRVFETLLIKQDTVRHYENIQAWLFTVLGNLIRSEHQKSKYSQEFSIEELSTEPPSPEAKATSLLDTLPAELSRQEKIILYLYYECQLTHENVGKRLNCSPSASRMRLLRAKARYKECISSKKLPKPRDIQQHSTNIETGGVNDAPCPERPDRQDR